MRKLLIFIGLCLTFTAFSQYNAMHFVVTPPLTVAEAATYTTQYQAVLDAWGYTPGGDTATWQNNLMYSLDTAFSGRIDFMNVYATSRKTLIDWYNPDSLSFEVNPNTTLTWVADSGYTSGISTDYVNLSWIPSIDGDNWTQDSAAFIVYISRSNTPTTGASYALGGILAANASIRLSSHYDVSNVLYSINNGSITGIDTNVADTTGTFGVSRRTGGHELYIRGVSNDTESDGSEALVSDTLTALHYGANYFDGIVGLIILTDGLSDDEQAKMNTIIETYMDAIGCGVQ